MSRTRRAVPKGSFTLSERAEARFQRGHISSPGRDAQTTFGIEVSGAKAKRAARRARSKLERKRAERALQDEIEGLINGD
jgi:hypothetical protein